MKEQDPVRQVNRLACALDGIYHQAAWKLGLSDSVMCVLYMLHERGDGCSLHKIYRDSGISKQTVHSAIRKLEGENILYLQAGKGKEKAVWLTEMGRDYVNRTAARVYEAEREMFQDWSEEEFDQYLHLMEKHYHQLRGKIEQWEGTNL